MQDQRKTRGRFEYRCDSGDKIMVCSWNDNPVVTLASNALSVFPTSKVSRWLMKEGKRVQVEQPNVIHQYNQNLGVVDRMNQNVGVYRISMGSKKWSRPTFAFLPDVCMQNAWLLYMMSPGHTAMPLDLLTFKRSVVDVYRRVHVTAKQIKKPMLSTPNSAQKIKMTPDDIRRDGR